MGGGDENATQDMGRFIAGVDFLRRVTGAAVLALHHSGWNETRERGNSSLRGAADTMMSLTPKDGSLVLEVTKQKDAQPTDKIRLPEKNQVEPIQDLIAMALERRPEIEQARIRIENSKISIKGTRNALLPSLDLVAGFQNNGLAGTVNMVPVVPQPGVPLVDARTPETVDRFFLGGYGTALSQLFARNFPDYSVSFQLNIPLRNRQAQADLIRDQLAFRQQQIDEQKARNQIRLNVLNAHVALQQARAGYETSVKARLLQEQTFNGERTKYQLGTSSFLNVVIVQRDLRARVQLEDVTGATMDKYNVSIAEAYSGVVKRAPDLLPVLDQR